MVIGTAVCFTFLCYGCHYYIITYKLYILLDQRVSFLYWYVGYPDVFWQLFFFFLIFVFGKRQKKAKEKKKIYSSIFYFLFSPFYCFFFCLPICTQIHIKLYRQYKKKKKNRLLCEKMSSYVSFLIWFCYIETVTVEVVILSEDKIYSLLIL